MTEEQKNIGWWAAIPGTLKALVGCITAISGLILTLHQTGITIEKFKELKCNAPWKWDAGINSCIKEVTLAKKNYTVALDRPIKEIDGRIDFYLNTNRLEDVTGRAEYKDSRGSIQIVIPIMQGNTMIGDMREVIYSTSEGAICNISGLTEPTGWIKKMKVRYMVLLPDCEQVDKTCHARLDSSQKRVQIGMEPLTVTISKSC